MIDQFSRAVSISVGVAAGLFSVLVFVCLVPDIVLQVLRFYIIGVFGVSVVGGLIFFFAQTLWNIIRAVHNLPSFIRDLACVIRNWNEIVYALRHMDDPEEGA